MDAVLRTHPQKTKLEMSSRLAYSVLIIALGSVVPLVTCADDPPSAVGAVMKLLNSGRVPESRLETIVELVGTRGNEHDLAYLLAEAAPEGHWPTALRLKTFSLLLDAAQTRKVVPAGELSRVADLLNSKNVDIQLAGIRLAGQWKTAQTKEQLQQLATSESAPQTVRDAALQSLRKIDQDAALSAVKVLLHSEKPFNVRAGAVAVMASIDLNAAATAAVKQLKQAGERDDPAPIVDAFLDIDGGSKVLAEAIGAMPIRKDVAKLALRHMYSIGRSDRELSDVLGKLAGFDTNPQPPTKEEIAQLVAEAARQGDARRGELVFRRSDLSCMKCHSVSKAGGQIGPELSALGSSSPMDYIVTSVLDPDQAIKEAFVTKVVVTVDGKIHQGIVADRTDERLVLKDANGKLITIAVSDIEEEIEGKSLMPKGLVKFMTHAEFLDLAKFLSMLGKSGPYAIRSTPRMQRWRLLTGASPDLLNDVPNETTFENDVLLSPNWISVYAMVDGHLPLQELAERTGQSVVYVQGEVDVIKGGKVGVKLNAADGVNIWIDDGSVPAKANFTTELEPGRHALTLRINLEKRMQPSIKLELEPLPGSEAEFSVVDGQ